jgi:hypothetical protein
LFCVKGVIKIEVTLVQILAHRRSGQNLRCSVRKLTAIACRAFRCHAKNVCIEQSVKLSLGDFFQRDEFINAGVIDQNVDFAERFLRLSEEPFNFSFLRDVALDGKLPFRLPC